MIPHGGPDPSSREPSDKICCSQSHAERSTFSGLKMHREGKERPLSRCASWGEGFFFYFKMIAQLKPLLHPWKRPHNSTKKANMVINLISDCTWMHRNSNVAIWEEKFDVLSTINFLYVVSHFWSLFFQFSHRLVFSRYLQKLAIFEKRNCCYHCFRTIFSGFSIFSHESR